MLANNRAFARRNLVGLFSGDRVTYVREFESDGRNCCIRDSGPLRRTIAGDPGDASGRVNNRDAISPGSRYSLVYQEIL